MRIMSTHLEKPLTELHSARPVMWLQSLDSLHMIRVEQLFMENIPDNRFSNTFNCRYSSDTCPRVLLHVF
ncbi:hypothetical protein C0J52_24724 [Blattella germanica]|nr:hypothetical protein C0J52_24724 [Blattella germanica]